ncbi:ABC transporter substrate-binding protein [Desulfosediminicola ganghwensis]|uniref:ABC transporter substrate-binding protein n=1 Tax=Desulfosediminicola ganghwensis TaxID=2569540 RepID=UPI0010ABD1FD|nr:ABC transporter substrate-binding protein [Desulfosediminicola ganghwensis]
MKHNRGNSTCSLDLSRRRLLKATVITAGTATALALLGGKPSPSFGGTKKGDGETRLLIGGYKFDRTAALVDGSIEIAGYNVQFEESGIGDLNTHVFSGPQTLDVTEIGLHPYMLAFANEGFRQYALLPVFPLRTFRHKSVFIRNDRGIAKPQDLRGKRVATAGYSSTSLTWIRGIFKDEYGVAPDEIEWVISGKDSSAKEAGKISRQENILPEGVAISMGPEGRDESDLLESGEVDACFHAAEPRAYRQGHPNIRRLFPDYRSVEQRYFAKTGIFPIMHAVAIKRTLVESNPEIIRAVFAAYSQAKHVAYDYLAKLAPLMDSLPWIGQEFEETKKLMGDNFYSYGITPNRKPLETLFRYSHEQGLCSRNLQIEEIFAPGSIELTES